MILGKGPSKVAKLSLRLNNNKFMSREDLKSFFLRLDFNYNESHLLLNWVWVEGGVREGLKYSMQRKKFHEMFYHLVISVVNLAKISKRFFFLEYNVL